MLAMVFAAIYLAIFLWFSCLGYLAQSPLWCLIGRPRANGDLPSAPLINPKYLGGDDTGPLMTSVKTPSTGARLGWSFLIGVVWSTGFWLLSSYLYERYKLDPTRSAGRDGFLISTGSLCAAAMLVNLTLWAIKPRLRTHEG
jgi:hypothetical protein